MFAPSRPGRALVRRDRGAGRWRWLPAAQRRHRRRSKLRAGRAGWRDRRSAFSKSRCPLQWPHCNMAYTAVRTRARHRSRPGVSRPGRRRRPNRYRFSGPAADRGGIGQAIRIFQTRQCLFPRAVLCKAPPQCLTARQQTVVRVRERKQRQEGEGLLATGAATASDANPVVLLIVRLLAAASMADDRIALTNRASPQDDFGAVRRPIRFELVRRDGKWDKQNRCSSGLCPPALTRQDLSREAELLPPETKIQLEENNPSGLQLLGV